MSEASFKALKECVLKFEAKNQELTSVPKKLVDQFGYACLANSLMFKEPKIPKCNVEGISEYFKTHAFNTLNSLISYIKSLDDDIDKLFAIFSYAALNIQYDTEAYFSGNHSSATLESVFETKRAVCAGYSIFFKELAKRVNINARRIVIKEYSNYAKGFSFNPLMDPACCPKSNHASIYVTIDGVPFICEPTWAAGYINSSNKFEWSYNTSLFLIPFYKSLCDHFPCDESASLLPFKFTFDDFMKSSNVGQKYERHLKTESNPLVKIASQNGYVEQIFSCKGPIDWVSVQIYKKNGNNYTQISDDSISSYEVVQKSIPGHRERCRFRTSIAFPSEGFYEVKMYIDGPWVLSYYVNCLSKSSISPPLKYNPFHESKFIPISPKRLLSKVKHGVALIRFAATPKRANILWNIEKVSPNKEEISRGCGRYIQLKIPFDNERIEDQVCISFPSDGRYSVLFYFANDKGSYTSYITYFFDVTGVRSENNNVSPASFLTKGRELASGEGEYVSPELLENLNEPSKKEKKLMDELRLMVSLAKDHSDEEAQRGKNNRKDNRISNNYESCDFDASSGNCDDSNNDDNYARSKDDKQSSKCCLLI